MNRFRINQILDVLLFPYCDPDLQKKDFLYQKYCAYRCICGTGNGKHFHDGRADDKE